MVMGVPKIVSRNVSVSASSRRVVDRRLSKAVSVRIAVLLVAVYRATVARATSGGYCRASCRGDTVAVVVQGVRKEEGCISRERWIIEPDRGCAANRVFCYCDNARVVDWSGRNAMQPIRWLRQSMQGSEQQATLLSALQVWRPTATRLM